MTTTKDGRRSRRHNVIRIRSRKRLTRSNLCLISAGTDILKKRLQEQGAAGMIPNTAMIPNDYSSLKPVQNHVAQRSASLSMHQGGGGGPYGAGETPPGGTPDIMDGMIPSSVSPGYHQARLNAVDSSVPPSRDMSIPLPNHHQQQQQQQQQPDPPLRTGYPNGQSNTAAVRADSAILSEKRALLGTVKFHDS
ncbi:hypothetical protein LSH36_532g05006 [Paralvinella palmiformis]|uniref:Uncharacterized protein n=1 Tax=Paralvinella palmiformis TaxID=53620 RepID=A0AAD9MWA9_9ANNE|nr:hypothetical protein LSH36_532g05006 [Paralvinella palmiformis]